MHSTIASMRRESMKPRRVSSGQRTREPYLLHQHGHHHPWSRRQFLQGSVALLGTVASLGFSQGTVLAAKPGTGIPKPLPDFSPLLFDVFGVDIPFFLPIEVDPFTGELDPLANPSTITDFNGFIGLVEAAGVSDAENNADGVPRTWACDVRFMEGVFADRAGRKQRGAFGFF